MKKLTVSLLVLVFALVCSFTGAFAFEQSGIGKVDNAGYILILAQDGKNLVTKDNTIFVDTRAKDVFATKHVKGSVNLTLNELANHFQNGAFNGKNVFLLYNGATRGGVNWSGIDILGALYSVFVYLYSLFTVVPIELVDLVLEGFLGIDLDYNQPIPGLPPLDGNLLRIENPGSMELQSKSANSFNPLSAVISAANVVGFKGVAIPLSAFENAVFESN